MYVRALCAGDFTHKYIKRFYVFDFHVFNVFLFCCKQEAQLSDRTMRYVS